MSRVDVRGIRREQILQATERIVASRGWQAATFAEICKEAGVSNRVLTYHFSDKEDVLFSLLERWAEAMRGGVLGAVDPAMATEEALVGAVLRGLEIAGSDPRYRLALHFLTLAPYRPDIADRLRAMAQASRRRLAVLIGGGMAAGHLASGDPEGLAFALQASIGGMVLMRVALDLPVSEAAVRALVRRVLAGSPVEGGGPS